MKAEDFIDELTNTTVREAADSTVLPIKLHKKELDAKLRAVLFLLQNICSHVVWEDLGQILLCGNGASEYYDLVCSFLVFVGKRDISLLTNPLVSEMDRFCEKVSEETYCSVLREFDLKYCSHNGSLYSMCAILHLLIIEWYGRGMQTCGWSSLRVSVFGKADLTLLELIVLFFDFNLKFNTTYYPVRQKDVNAIKSVLNIVNGTNFGEKLLVVLRELMGVVDLKTVFSASVYSAFVNLFSVEERVNLCLHFANIEREDFSKGNAIDGAVTTIINGAGLDIIKHRNLLVRGKGVTINFNKSFDRISEVTLSEVHKDGLHYIYVNYCLNGCHYRELVFNIENLETTFMTFMYEIDFTLAIGIMCWLGLEDKLIEGLNHSELSSNNADVAEEYKNFIRQIAKYFEEENLYYSKPVWWNYEQMKSKTTLSAAELTKLVSVGTYSRRLPKGQQASSGAKALAEKYCMILEPGYTLVEGFERKQRVKAVRE